MNREKIIDQLETEVVGLRNERDQLKGSLDVQRDEFTRLRAELDEARQLLAATKRIAQTLHGAEGRLTPDYGEVSGPQFQMMCMDVDPAGLALAINDLASHFIFKKEE